jgi:hypothetical protein
MYRPLVASRLLALICLAMAAPAYPQDAGSARLDVSNVLKKIGDDLAEARAGTCTFVEKTTVEELDSDKKVTAREVHTYRVERSPSTLKKTLVSMKKDFGELNSRLRPKQDSELTKEEEERRRNLKTPVHFQEQPAYRFTSKQPGTIAFEPLERDETKSVGLVTVDPESGRLLTLSSKPSKYPAFLSQLDVGVVYGITPCGLEATRFELSGEGGFLFVRTRFHTVTVIDGHAPKAR